MAARKYRETFYAETTAGYMIKKSTKADLEKFILNQARTIGQQAKELQRLRDELSDACEERERYRNIERALHVLAAQRVKADKMTPKAAPPDARQIDFFKRGGNHSFERTSVEVRKQNGCTTQPQALAVELSELKVAVDQLKRSEEERAANEAAFEEAEDEVSKLLDALGLDECEWDKMRWKF